MILSNPRDLIARRAVLDQAGLRGARPWPELDRLVGAVAVLLDVPCVILTAVDVDRQFFHAVHGVSEGTGARLRTDEVSPLCRQVVFGAQPMLIQDARARLAGVSSGLAGLDIAAYAGVPISVAGQSVAALAAIDHAPRAWQDRDLVVLRALAEAAGAIIECRRMESEHDQLVAMEATALHDDLTGLLNRRGFRLVAESHLALARRDQFSGLLVYLDLDGLKQANDRHGHAIGDILLQDAAKALRDTFRESDTLARLGGDEFAALSVHAEAHDEAALRDRLDETIRRTNVARDSRVPLAWSIGMALFDPEQPRSLDDLVVAADKAMYGAKQRRS